MPVTVYTASPALTTTNNNSNINFRHVLQLSATPNGQLRVRFKAGAAVLSVRGAAIGKWDGTTLGFSNHNMTAPAIRVTFGGGNVISGAISSGGTETSDFVNVAGLGLAAGDWVIVTSVYQSGWGTEQVYSDGHSTAVCWFKSTGTDESQVQNGTGYVSSGTTIQPGGGSNGRNFSVDLIETNDPAGGAYTMPAAVGTTTMAGQIAGLRAARNTAGGLGTLTPAGQVAGLRAARKTAGGLGTLTPAGQAATLSYARVMPAGLGTLAMAGPVVNLIYSTGPAILPAGVGVMTIGGQAATLARSTVMPVATGALVIGGQAAALARSTVMSAELGALTISGQTVELDYTEAITNHYTMTVTTGTLTIAGQDAALVADIKNHYVMAAGSSTLMMTGFPAPVRYGPALQQPGVFKFGRRVTIPNRW
jgi:hypothetical protein